MIGQYSPDSGRKQPNPLWLVAPASVVIFALGWSNLGGLPVALLAGVTGLAWVCGLGLLAGRIRRNAVWQRRLATGAALLAGITLFTMMGGGLYEYLLFSKALETSPEWITTLTSGPLAEQVILYFILFNSLMEILFVPLAVLLNWGYPRRRPFVLAGALIFYGIRIWTYLYFAPQYFEFGEMAFSPAFLDLLASRMAIDTLRFGLQTLEAGLFFLAALAPAFPAQPPGEG